MKTLINIAHVVSALGALGFIFMALWTAWYTPAWGLLEFLAMAFALAAVAGICKELSK